jgi:hypothetical protein
LKRAPSWPARNEIYRGNLVEISKEMQDRAKAGLKLAVGSAAIYSLTCWRTPVGRPTGVPLKQHTDQRRLS